jgi:hypothetical protein
MNKKYYIKSSKGYIRDLEYSMGAILGFGFTNNIELADKFIDSETNDVTDIMNDLKYAMLEDDSDEIIEFELEEVE